MHHPKTNTSKQFHKSNELKSEDEIKQPQGHIIIRQLFPNHRWKILPRAIPLEKNSASLAKISEFSPAHGKRQKAVNELLQLRNSFLRYAKTKLTRRSLLLTKETRHDVFA